MYTFGMNTKIAKTDAYNPPTEYDTSKVYIVRIEIVYDIHDIGVVYKIIFHGKPEDLKNTQMLLEQSELHLKHENLTGFKPRFPWDPPVIKGNIAERTCSFIQYTL